MSSPLPDLFIGPDIDNRKAVVTFTAPPGCSGAAWRILDGEREVAHGDLPNVRTGTQLPVLTFDADIPDLKLWELHDPHLYTLSLRLALPGGAEEVREHFGMRKIHVTPEYIHVNNRPFLVRGVIRGREAHDHPNLENLPLEEYYAKYIRAAKDYGFNLIRFHSRVPPDEYFRAADRLGIFTHVEIRPYFGRYQKDRKFLNDAVDLIDENAWRDTIIRLRNHPSLMVYCVGNEIRKPGRNPQVEHLAHVAHELDPTRLFLDTCAHGEFDRTYVDFDVQHMGYFYPFGKDWTMFENRQNWLIYGSCKDVPVEAKGDGWRVTRALAPKRPILAHEACHYVALRDLDALEAKFDKHHVEKPWWIAELRKLIKAKGLEKDYQRMLAASQRFQFVGWKLGIEAARRSPVLAGFHFLQLADTDRYENANGIIDCFDESKGLDEAAFRRFNGDSVLLADLPRRTFFEGEQVTVPVILSHFSAALSGTADFSFTLTSASAKRVTAQGKLEKIDLDERGRREICQVTMEMPHTEQPEAMWLGFRLTKPGGSGAVENEWAVWVVPNRPDSVPSLSATVALDDIDITHRYPQIQSRGSLASPQHLMIINHFTKEVLAHLDQGGDVLMLYRVPATRDRKVHAVPEEYYLPATWDRFKGVIWDRGHNLGFFIRFSPALGGFPNGGLLDLQFHALVNDADKIILDDFPVRVEPIIQGVDKASRDRFDVFTYKLSELQPDRTLRRFAYLFELAVGKGRLLVSGFNFTGLNRDVPETCAMFESLLRYVVSGDFRPKDSISAQALADYLLAKGRGPIVKERRMTQYWQLDEEPLESAEYWAESLRYLGEEIKQPDQFA